MNQILSIGKYKKKIINILKFQILCSTIGIISVLAFSNSSSSNSADNFSKELFVTQKLSTIYQTQKQEKTQEPDSEILGSIEIPKIGIVYPVFNIFTEELLDLSPCKFNGPNLGENGNISIAGHNLENNTFFSNLNQLDINDIIYLYSNTGEKFEYIVYKTYETNSDDLTPIATNFIGKKELTLVTCNNANKKRFIVKALCDY